MELINEAFKVGVIPGLVLAIYLIIIKLLDTKKENKETKVNNELINTLSNINTFIVSITSNILSNDKDKCKSAIRNSLNGYSFNIIKFVIRTVIDNNIEVNKENIIFNFRDIIKTEYYNTYHTLMMYTIDNQNVSNWLKEVWMDEIEKIVLGIIYNNNFDAKQKIIYCTNRLTSLYQSYITYLTNKIK